MNIVEIYKDSFKKMFEVDIFHDYFLKKYYFDPNTNSLVEDTSPATVASLNSHYSVTDFFDIQPTKACVKLFKDYKIVFRKNQRGFATFIWQDGTGRPKIPLEEDAVFEFSIFLKDNNFFNYTALPLDSLPRIYDVDAYYRSIYLFSNNNGNAQAPYLTKNMTAAVEDRVSSRPYSYIQQEIGLISLAVKNTLGDPKFDILNNNGMLTGKTYMINFLAREARWRYRNQTALIGISDIPLPLSSSGINPVFINGNLENLPSADVKMINFPPNIDINNPDSNLMFSIIYL